MNKILVGAIAMLTLVGASVASAQTYYSYAQTSSAVCANISTDLRLGARGSQVTALQQFLVGQNYPGSGSWMVTGYYGQATAAAVRNFQQLNGLPITGEVDFATRSAINRAGCTGTYGSYTPTYSYPTTYTNPFSYNYSYPTYPYNNTYGSSWYGNYVNPNYTYGTSYYNQCGSFPYYYPCTNTYLTSVTLSSLTPLSGLPGTTVTLYGTGFDRVNNTVYVGGKTLTGIPSYNGNTLQFQIPAGMVGGPVSVSVATPSAQATSNKLTFTIDGGVNPNQNWCGWGAGYGYPYGYCPPQQGPISISYLSPSFGAVGTSVTVYGWGFSYSDNTVHFGNGIIAGLRSTDGRSVSFIVPAQLSGYGYQPIGLGSYDVSVTNSSGQTSNAVPFTITSTGTTGNLSVSNITGPTNLTAGQSGTWSITATSQSGTTLFASATWGDENLYSGYAVSTAPQAIYSTGSNTITFTHAYQYAGTYTVRFTVQNGTGQQQSASITVYVSGSSNTGSVVLSSISPTIASRGAQILLTGSGFTGDNTVHFGVGGTAHLPSQSGNYIPYTIPYYISACDLIGTSCGAPTQQVTPGTYPIYVTNSNGTSQTIYVQVQ